MSDWARLRDGLDALIALPESERGAEMERRAAENPALAAELERLLAAATEGEGFLRESAVARIAAAAAGRSARGAAPERVGPYRLERRIGEGGMGQVWLGRRDDGAFDQLVAVKLVRADLAPGAVDERLAAERRILAGLEHPGIARLIDGGTTVEGAGYLVLEYVDGAPVDTWCDARALGLDARLALFVTICSAVDFAHRKLVLHRDLKPSNVLVDGTGRPRLLDFGIAKLLDPLATSVESTLPDAPRPMTPAWASPEQLRGEPLTFASDVWSLGLLLCVLTAGRRPPLPDAGSGERLARALEEQGPPRLAELAMAGAAPGVDARRLAGDLERVVARALDPDPANRYPTAAALAADVEAFRTGRPVSAHPPSFLYLARKFVRRHVAGVAAAAAGVVALVALAVVSLGQARRAEIERARAERRLSELRELTGGFLFEFERKLSDLAGSTALRRDVTAVALRYLDLLAREASDDPALLADLAHGFYQLGRIQRSPFYASLGDTKAALASAERALELATRLEALAPESAAAKTALAEARSLRSDLHFAAADYAVAERDVVAAIAEARAAFERTPFDQGPARREARRLLLQILARHGIIVAAAGRSVDAVAAHRVATDAAAEAARDDPATFERTWLITRMLLGEALALAGRPAEALIELEPTVAALDARRAREPENPVVEREYSAAVDRAVVALLAVGRAEEALALSEKGLASSERRAALDPDDHLGQWDLVASRSQVASAALAAGELGRAAKEYTLGRDEIRRLLVRHPDDLTYRCGLAEFEIGLADLLERRGERERARRGLSEAAATVEQVLATAPGHAEATRLLALAREKLETTR